MFLESIDHGTNFHYFKSSKFKTLTMTLLIRTPLMRYTVTKNALLAGVLNAGCRKYPTEAAIYKQAEELYGASFEVGVVKKGEQHLLQIYCEVLGDDTVNSNQSLIEQAIAFIGDVLFDPLLYNGTFKPLIVEREKKRLAKSIRSRVDDKRSYAIERCVELMCEEEAFGIRGDGYEEELEDLDAQAMTDYYRHLISSAPMEFAAIGDASYCKKVLQSVQKLFEKREVEQLIAFPEPITKYAAPERVEKETMGLSQGKLVIGTRCRRIEKTEDFYALLLLNTIFGGGAHSRLFRIVREQKGLCYNISSFLYRTKSILMIQAGIAPDNYDQCMEIIRQILNELVLNGISNEELALAKQTLSAEFSAMRDTPASAMNYFLSGYLAGDQTSLREAPGLIQKITLDQVIVQASGIHIDTSYFLS